MKNMSSSLQYHSYYHIGEEYLVKMSDRSVGKKLCRLTRSQYLDKKFHKGCNTIEEYSWEISYLKHTQRTPCL